MVRGLVRPLACAAFTLTAMAAVSPAQAVSGQQLLDQCSALERGAVVSGQTVRLPQGQDAASCWVYMAAIQDLSATVEKQGGPSVIGSCIPPDTTRLQIVQAFTRYARGRRSELSLRATALVIPALIDAFPCPEQS